MVIYMKRIESLDFTRSISMLAVIMIHVTSTYVNNESAFTVLNMNLAFFLNQISRFAVPLFILLSGASLGLSPDRSSFASFISKRVLKTGIPYILWYMFYAFYNSGFVCSIFFHNFQNVSLIFKKLFLGQAAPHLYFITIIFQFYLLYPLLKRMVEHAPIKSILGAFSISYIIQNLYLFEEHGLDLIPTFIEPYLWVLFPTWIFYFMVGMVLTRKRITALITFSIQNAIPLLIITAVFSVLYSIDSNLTGNLDSIKTPLNAYTLLILVTSFSIWGLIGKYVIAQKINNLLAKHSLSIYFGHVLVLYFFRRFYFFSTGIIGMLLLYLAVLIVSVILSVMLDEGVKSILYRIKKSSISIRPV